MINIVLFGPPGSGKGTQAQKLIQRYGIKHISTGEIIREEIRQGTKLGKEAAGYIEQGFLAPDDLVVRIIEEYIEENKGSVGNIFDGFPRTSAQAEAFDRILDRHGLSVTLMVSLEVSDDVLVDRILLRGKESGRVDDSDISIIRNRIDVYKSQTVVVADYYRGQSKFYPIQGEGTVDEVFDRLCRRIDEILESETV